MSSKTPPDKGRVDVRAIQLVKVLDGLLYSFKLLEYHHAQLYPACCKIRDDANMAVPALASAWGFIDVLHRARELAQQVPGLSNRNRELVHFLHKTSLAETYRDYIQHLREELGRAASHDFPVWGSLSWVDPGDALTSHAVLIGSCPPNTKTSFGGMFFDRFEKKWVSRVCLSIQRSAFNFDIVQKAAERFEAFIIPWMLDRCGSEKRIMKHLPMISARVLLGGPHGTPSVNAPVPITPPPAPPPQTAN